MWQREEKEGIGPVEMHIKDVVSAEGGDRKWLDPSWGRKQCWKKRTE